MILPAGRVLVVEDDETLSAVVVALLEQENYEVLRAADGERALRLAIEEKPDVVLLDVLLPKMNGFEVCQRLRQEPETCLIPVLLTSARGETKDKVTGFKLGADEFMAKPFDPLELLARVERTVRRSREDLAANPLTGLPGPVALDREIKRRWLAGDVFSLGRAEVAGLSSFHRAYGYEAGDHVIRLAGMILRSAAKELGNPTDFVAHVGGPRFAFLSTPARAPVVASRAMENADVLLLMQYDARDRSVLSTEELTPRERLRLYFGLVDVPPSPVGHPRSLLDQAAEALAAARRGSGLMALQ